MSFNTSTPTASDVSDATTTNETQRTALVPLTADIELAVESALSTLETVAYTKATGKGVKAAEKAAHRLTQGADVTVFAAHNKAAASHLLASAERASIDRHARNMAAQAAGCYTAPIATIVAIADTAYTVSSVTLEGKAHALRKDWLSLRTHLAGMLANRVVKGEEKPVAVATAKRVNAALAVYDAIDSAVGTYRQQLADGTVTARDLLRLN